MKRYECTQGFSVERYDDDGSVIENEYFNIKAGTVWHDEEETYRFLGGDVRLEHEDGTWIEMPKENVTAWFKEIT